MKINKKIVGVFFVIVLFAGLIPGIVIGIILPEVKKEQDQARQWIKDFWAKYQFDLKSEESSLDLKTNKKWNINQLEQQIKEIGNFIVYYGDSSCSFCGSLTKQIKEDENLTHALINAKEKKGDYLLYLYYENNKLFDKNNKGTKERKDMTKNLINLLTDKKATGISIEDEGGGIGVPAWFFFKAGKVVEKINPLGLDKENLEKKVGFKNTIAKIKKHYH